MNDLSYTAKVFKTVWVSDVHLGTKGSRAKEFLEFLKTIECEKIFLVGDIVDGWQLSKRWYWPQTHNDVVQKILEKAKRGTEIIFIPGNHDEVARDFIGLTMGGIKVKDDDIHFTADGKNSGLFTAIYSIMLSSTQDGLPILATGRMYFS